MEYGQFCPVAKATEILGEKWTILIVRELLLGATRFNELQRGLTQISPTLLSKRLDTLEHYGLVLKKKIPGQKGHEYFATESCRELTPIVFKLGEWGMRWARSKLSEKDYDVELLMLYLQRSIIPEKLIGKETVVRFQFTDIKEYPSWWLVAQGSELDVCTNDPGKEVDVYFTSTVRTLADIWMGDRSYKQAQREGDMTIVGNPMLIRDITAWMANSIYADLPPASEI
ncbi:MAG: winged helix-turn-helix transcriptional regulator [Gammaproteobacteria bacterium]|nr:winged helix-turn-helix transcriptional regulator [Gammaproteobacteria bacterium]MDH5800903.1 winged helix-turn-helix transcriptional regulator [Gammaproteobacteria bacterium]